MFDLGFKEIIIIAVILLILFGSRKIPELAQSLVDAMKTLRRGLRDDNEISSKKK